MFRTLQQLGVNTLVALATVVLIVPTLARPACACPTQSADDSSALSRCANRPVGACCEKPSASADDCCPGTGPCQCPGCQCSIAAPDAVPVRSLATPELSKHITPLDLSLISFAAIAEPAPQSIRTEQFLLQSPAAPLRALYCVWII
jgi:hypothetical protein